MMSDYNIHLNSSRTQSSLGRKEVDVYKEGEAYSKLLLATVVGVNLAYNTVELVTTKNNENLIKSVLSKGKFSARVPVTFGGSWSNGRTYGQVVPITVGDLVLVGFIDSNIDSPIVINIYKSDVVSNELAKGDGVSINPEGVDYYKQAMAFNTVYPSQTLNFNMGDGSTLRTFAGNTFFATSTDDESQLALTDTYMEYEDLPDVYRSNGTIYEPVDTGVPRLLFTQYTTGITSNKTTFFHDEFGVMRLSKVLLDQSKRTYMEMNNTGDIQLRHRRTSPEPYTPYNYLLDGDDNDDAGVSLDSYIGILGGTPTIYNQDFTLEIRGGTMFLNGVDIADILEEYTAELQVEVANLTTQVEDAVTQLAKLDIDALSHIQTDFDNLETKVTANELNIATLSSTMSTISSTLSTFIDDEYATFKRNTNLLLTSHTSDINALDTELNNARETYDNLSARLSDMTFNINKSSNTLSGISNIESHMEYTDIGVVNFTFDTPYTTLPNITVGIINAEGQNSFPTITPTTTTINGAVRYTGATVTVGMTSGTVCIQVMSAST